MALSVVSEKLNLVLCGSDGAVKSSISDLILGQREPSPGSSSVCVRREGAVCGRRVTLVEMPALYNTQLSEEEVMQETLRCVSLCDPGVHAFLLVVPEGRLTREDKGEIEKVQTIFGSTFNNYAMVLIVRETRRAIADLDEATKYIIETCKGRSHVLDTNRKSVLLKDVEQMIAQNSQRYYTTLMYCNAQVETQLKYKAEVEQLKATVNDLREQINKIQEASPRTEDTRILLLGKTGVGKSASGNTILEKKAFRELLSARLVTSVCQKESAEVRGRQISVIDTPGLFDTGVANEEISKEIAKCITMAAPGPHVFLLVLSLGRFTQEEEEAVKMIQDLFGDESRRYTMVLFTRGDDLQGRSFEDFIKDSEPSLQNLLHQCGNRYHVFNNSLNDHSQVTDLLEKIDSMVAVNGGSCYTNEMFQQTEKALKEEQERILKERDDEIEREKEELKKKHEAEMEQMEKSMEDFRKHLEKDRRRKEESFRLREALVKMEKNEEVRREIDEKLRAQQEAFFKETERKEQAHIEQMQKDRECQQQMFKREKNKIRKEAEDEARRQAEREFCTKLEIAVIKAREYGKKEGYEEGRRAATGDSGSRQEHLGQTANQVVSLVGALICNIVVKYITR